MTNNVSVEKRQYLACCAINCIRQTKMVPNKKGELELNTSGFSIERTCRFVNEGCPFPRRPKKYVRTQKLVYTYKNTGSSPQSPPAV